MSVRLMAEVFDRYPSGGGEMLLALALADHADDGGENIYPSVKTLALKTRQSERTVQYQLRRMEEAGWLIRVGRGNGGRNQATEYRISPLWIKGAEIAPLEKGANGDIKGATDGIKGANGDIKGCNPEHKRVQPIAPAYNRHRTIKEPSGIVESARAHQRDAAAATTTLPADFTPGEAAAAMAAQHGLDLAAECAAFADHHAAHGTRYRDWQAALRTWLRNADRFARRDARQATARRSTPPPKSFAQQERERGIERWEQMTGRIHPDRRADSSHAAGPILDVTELPPIARPALFAHPTTETAP